MRSEKISTHEPVSQLKYVPIIECGEPLVDYLKLSDRLVQGPGFWEHTRFSLLRKTAAEMLAQAAESLPNGYVISVTEGFRAPHIQRRMHLASYLRWKERHPDWTNTSLMRMTNRFTAPISKIVPPPHTTGGAVDVFLADEKGERFNHIAPYELRDRRAYPPSAKGLLPETQRVRAILREAMQVGGMTNYPSEYWHWSYGDQGWAYRGRHPHAIYGPILPEGWSPPGGEDIDAPLKWTMK